MSGQIIGNHLAGEPEVDRDVGIRDADVAPDFQRRVEVSEQLESVEVGVARIGQFAPVCLRHLGADDRDGPFVEGEGVAGAGASAWSNSKSSPSSS